MTRKSSAPTTDRIVLDMVRLPYAGARISGARFFVSRGVFPFAVLGSLCLVVFLFLSNSAQGEGPPRSRPILLPKPAGGSEEKPAELTRLRRRSNVMGTSLEITVVGNVEAELESAITAAALEMKRVEDLMTDWRPSALTRLNERAGEGPCAVPRELLEIIDRGLKLGARTSGAFDITYAGAGRLWDFKRKPPVIPTPEEIERALKSVGYRRVRIDRGAGTVELEGTMRIGLGGIAKGYGVDRAMAVIRGRGIVSAVVNAGGDLRSRGSDLTGSGWEVEVVHPREPGRGLARFRLEDASLATSGDYSRFFVLDGVRYHHILDPRTGSPARGCITASVVAPRAEEADALATALCVLGPEAGLELVASLPEVEALCVSLDGRVFASKGLEESLLGEEREN